MRRSRKGPRPQPVLVPQFRANDRITAPEVRLIDEASNMVGVVSLTEAKERAVAAELDLVEVSPKAEPPVCRIMDFGSFKYQKEKEARAQKAKQKATEIKGIRLSLRIGDHDRDIRLTAARKFLAENNKVRLELNLRGREKQHVETARVVLDECVTALADVAKVEQPFTRQGGKLSLVLTPKN